MEQKYKYCIYDELKEKNSNVEVNEFGWLTEAEHQLFVIFTINEEEYKNKLDELIELSLFKHEGSVSINGFTFKKERIWKKKSYHQLNQNGLKKS